MSAAFEPAATNAGITTIPQHAYHAIDKYARHHDFSTSRGVGLSADSGGSAADRADGGTGGVVGPYPAAAAERICPPSESWGGSGSADGGGGFVELSGASLTRSSSAGGGDVGDAPWLVLAKAAAVSGQDRPRGKTVMSKVWNPATGAVDVTSDPTRTQKRKHQINSVAQNALARQMEQSSQAALSSIGLGGAGNTGRIHKVTARAKYGW